MPRRSKLSFSSKTAENKPNVCICGLGLHLENHETKYTSQKKKRYTSIYFYNIFNTNNILW